MTSPLTDRDLLSGLAETTEAEYLWDMAEGAAADLKEALGVAGARIGGGVVRVVRNDPLGGFWNRSIGLGQREPITGAMLDEVLGFAAAHGAPLLCIQVAPDAQPAHFAGLMESRGVQPSAAWVKFMGPAPTIPEIATDLRVERLDPADAQAFAEVVVTSFGMPDGLMVDWIADQARRQDWAAFGAWDGDTIVAGALLYINGDVGH